MKNIASPKVSIGFIATLIVLVANAVVAYQSISTIADNNRAAMSRDRILTTLEKMRSTLKDVERCQQEYLFTDSLPYLNVHRVELAQVSTNLASIAKLKADVAQSPPVWLRSLPLSRPQLDPTQQVLASDVSQLTATLDRQAPRLTSDRRSELFQQGRQAIERVRQTINGLDRTEQIALDRLQAVSSKSLADTKIAFGISSLLDLLLLTVLYGLVRADLTKQQRAKSELRDYVTEFEELYHNAPCGYHSLDPAGNILRINRTELHLLGYAETEIVGRKQMRDLLTAESMGKLDRQLAIVKTRGSISDLEFEMVCKDGRIVPVSTTVVAMRDGDGHYLGARVTVIDISERVRLRKQARLSAEISQKIRQSLNLAEILETAVAEVYTLLGVDRVLIVRFEADGSSTVLQERVSANYPPIVNEIGVEPCIDPSYHSRYAQERIYTFDDITQAGFEPCYVEFLQQFAVKASAIVPIYLRSQLWGLLVVHHCQSPRQWQPKEVEILSQLATQIGIALAQAQLLEQEQIQRQELARSNAELEQFAHVASHDLQEPLRMVISYLQLLERRDRGQLDADAKEFIAYAVDGAVRMQALIQALLGYARVSSRKQLFDNVNCNVVIQDALSNLHVAIAESDAQISVEPLPTAWGDATQLTQLFQNLIGNAIKFRGDLPPQIQISVRAVTEPPAASTDGSGAEMSATPSAWCFAVADNGIGIEPQYLDRIFAIFQRLHTRVTYPGTGIGLAICKKIIERHGGTIWVESVPTIANFELQPLLPMSPQCVGSVFYFTIPAVGSISPQHAHK
ncbi:GAF domain-containing protein [Chamaesiphon sp. VAR_69_metabat_338]|uniref:GAF domain-containing protein n=1 Tax=Chamaesiphon sp. VAR_69_metabat_338 TaxID=2964704 RepID=UPI00286E30EE|nr:GAF domain-containing protein [Chamaesiphon sp. VAR_69_metabat_338]